VKIRRAWRQHPETIGSAAGNLWQRGRALAGGRSYESAPAAASIHRSLATLYTLVATLCVLAARWCGGSSVQLHRLTPFDSARLASKVTGGPPTHGLQT